MNAAFLLRGFLRVVTLILTLVAILPFIRTNLWWVRLCDFPRLQVAGLALVLLVFVVIFWAQMERIDRVLAGLLVAVVAIEIWFIFPYTPLARKAVPDASEPVAERTLDLVTANVLMENREASTLLAILRESDPDIILLAEPDAWWVEQCRSLETSHPFTVLQPQSNNYGMALYSRFELVEPQVLFRVEAGIPSIRAGVRLPSGAIIEIYAVHPRPPGIDPPDAEERLSSAPRDAELILVAREIEERDAPALVFGDYNDVAWSHTTRRFQRLGQLCDPRLGRGLFNTYHARYPLMRYPLDHVFHTGHFRLAGLERLPKFGSDHFPIFSSLVLQGENALKPSDAPTPEENDHTEAEETVQKASVENADH